MTWHFSLATMDVLYVRDTNRSAAMPPVTRALMVAEALVTVPCLVRAMSPADIALFWPYVLRKGQAWRMVTSFLYAGNGLAALMNTVVLLYVAFLTIAGRPRSWKCAVLWAPCPITLGRLVFWAPCCW